MTGSCCDLARGGSCRVRLLRDRLLAILAPDGHWVPGTDRGGRVGSVQANDPDRAAEVRIRAAVSAPSAAAAGVIGNEVEALYTNGPAGGGGAFKSTREVLAVASALVARESVRTQIELTPV